MSKRFASALASGAYRDDVVGVWASTRPFDRTMTLYRRHGVNISAGRTMKADLR